MKNKKRKSSKKREEFDSDVLDIARVTRVTAGGQRMRFRVTVAVGDKKGRVGIGMGKGLDIAKSIEKAKKRAEKNLIKVPIHENTIFHEVKAKFGSSEVLLKPQSKGRGLVAGGVMRTLCNLAGIKDISAKKISRGKNKINNANATLEAFKQLKETQENATSSTKTK